MSNDSKTQPEQIRMPYELYTLAVQAVEDGESPSRTAFYVRHIRTSVSGRVRELEDKIVELQARLDEARNALGVSRG